MHLDNVVLQVLVGGFIAAMLTTLLGAIYLGWKTRHYNEADEFSHIAEELHTTPPIARYAYTEIERKGMPHTFANLKSLVSECESETHTAS